MYLYITDSTLCLEWCGFLHLSLWVGAAPDMPPFRAALICAVCVILATWKMMHVALGSEQQKPASGTPSPPPTPAPPLVKKLRRMTFYDCDDGHHGGNRTARLFSQLVRVRGALEAAGIAHALAYGTLIGALRDGGMNPFEIDNDVVLVGRGEARLEARTLPDGFFEALWARGLIAPRSSPRRFKVCDARRDFSRRDPDSKGTMPCWGNDMDDPVYFPYTDLYKCDDPCDTEVVRIGFADTYMYIPPVAAAVAALDTEYQQGWRAPPTGEPYRGRRTESFKCGVNISDPSSFGEDPGYPIGVSPTPAG
eukprot:TRINITY_DN18509_c0_g1_i1.p1 TRINITY_DN18509_c0_g1~~TRINITY_DN18509_c0_g1_i1.p1  ORF type:complete len:308 (+),score=33.07 TRINITY_DN18509_c0_g1_i1:29-952(+)